MNWYKKIKIAWNTGIPLMENFDTKIKNRQSPYKEDPRSLVHHAPILGGEKRKGYPKDISFEKTEEDSQLKTIPTDESLIDTEIPFGEGAGAGDPLERFTDPIDKLRSFDKQPDPVGPHNMSHDTKANNFWNRLVRRSKLKNLNKV
ncbi:MAG TPA: hypothetical protein VMZ91_01710 [Candidatus Paceibacterota bacterium]|nr:hypothetical protein [Candidatus Paceibacterota bacterium]